jgi:hypothetical protein
MVFNFGDFTLESEWIDYSEWGVEGGHDEYFLHAVIDELPAGATDELWWGIENMPAEVDKFALPKFTLETVTTTPGGFESRAGNITSYEFNYLDVMQYFFALMDFHARPMSWYYRDAASTPIDLHAIPSLQYGNQFAASIGMKFTYEDDNGFGYWGMSNGLNLQLADDEAVLISTTELDKQVYFVGDEYTATVDVENIGNIDATNVHVYLVHARLGMHNNLVDVDVFYEEHIGTVAAGTTESVSYTDIAVSYVGYHPILAIITFESDADHEVEEVTDFFNIGVDEWIAGGHTYEWTTSTLTGAILLPPTDNLVPAFPQPQLEFDIDVAIVSVTPTFQFTYDVTITNVGDAATDIAFIQYYNDTELTLEDYASSQVGNVLKNSLVPIGNLRVTGIHLEPTESVTISMTFTVTEGVYEIMMAPPIALYDSRFQNDLIPTPPEPPGDVPDAIPMSLMQDATTTTDESVDANSWEDYGAATSVVGVRTDTGADGDGDDKTKATIGDNTLFLSAFGVMMVAVYFRRKR